MKSRLHQIQDWPERAHEAKWRAATLAKNCDVSLRSLQRFFKKKTGKSPKVLLFEQRQEFAIEMSRNNSQIKVIASDLDYKYSCHFSRDFKKHWGIPLTEAKRNIPET